MADSGLIFPPAFRLASEGMQAIAGGRLEFYAAGTTTPLTVYSDQALTVALGSTVHLDSGGHPVSTLGGTQKVVVYTGTALVKIVLKSADGAVVLATYDNVKCAQVSGAGTGSGRVEIPTEELAEATHIVTSDEYGKLLEINVTATNSGVILPLAIDAGDGKTITIKRKGGGANTLSTFPSGTNTIDGQPKFLLPSDGDSASFVSNGADEWKLYSFARAQLAGSKITENMLDPRIVGGLIKVGDIRITAHGTPDPGTWPCDGAEKSRTGEGAALFAKIGTTWGHGNGTTTFNVPTLAGLMLRIADGGAGNDSEATPITVTGAANNGSGLIRLTVPSTARWSTGRKLHVVDVGGVPNATGTWVVTVINGTTFDLQGSTWSGTYTSGGAVHSRYPSKPGGSFGDAVGSRQDDAVLKHTHSEGVPGSTSAGSGANPVGGNSTAAQTGETGTTGRFASENLVRNASVMAFIVYDSALAANASDAVHTIHNGTGTPSNVLGIDGDYYIDNNAGNPKWFGPKAAGAWPAGIQLRGPQGDPGYSFGWSTATTDANPGAGLIAANHATLSSATMLYVSKTDSYGNGIGDVIATWDDSTSATKLRLRLYDDTTRAKGIEATVTGALVDGATYWKIPLASVTVLSGGAPAASTKMLLQPFVTGDKGSAGPVPWLAPVPWATGLVCVVGPPATAVVYQGSTYVCTTAHTAGGAFDGTKFVLAAEKGAPGSAIEVRQNGTSIVAAADKMDFERPYFEVINGGSNLARVLDYYPMHADGMIAEWRFLERSGDTVRDNRGTNHITISAAASQNAAWTLRGLLLRGGCVQTPLINGGKTVAFAYRVKRGETAGCMMQYGMQVFGESVGSGAFHVGGGAGVAPLRYRTSTGTGAKRLNRGGWQIAFAYANQTVNVKAGFGGRPDLTTSRCAEFEIGWAGIWNDELTSGEKLTVYDGVRALLADRGLYIDWRDCPSYVDCAMLWGQSNADGRALITDLSATDQARTRMLNTLIAPASAFSQADAWASPELLQMGHNQKGPAGGTHPPSTKFGPEMGAAWRREDAHTTRERQLLISKYAIGGTNLAPTSAGGIPVGSWNVAELPTSGASCYYPALSHWWDTEHRMLARGIGPRLRALWWMQGEQDATSTVYSATYQADLQALWDQIHVDTGYTVGQLKAIIARIRNLDPTFNATAVAEVRAAQDAFVAANGANAALINTDTFPLMGDNVHYTAAGQKSLGQAFYDNTSFT